MVVLNKIQKYKDFKNKPKNHKNEFKIEFTSPFSWTFKLLPISILKCKNKQPNRDRATINEVMQQFGLEIRASNSQIFKKRFPSNLSKIQTVNSRNMKTQSKVANGKQIDSNVKLKDPNFQQQRTLQSQHRLEKKNI